MNDDDFLAWTTLSHCLDGRPDEWLRLVAIFDGASRMVGASDEALAAHGVSQAAIRALRDAALEAPRAMAACRRLGIDIAPHGSSSYPALLATIRDPPLMLFWRGADPASLTPALAMVGARKCSAYGERAARRIAGEAAAGGIVVLSGLARGIDAASHRGALETGRTAAVLAGGLDRIYPGEHRELADRIVASGGAVVSEQPPGIRPLPWLFPYRNRIITGLALATVVVEAGPKSGSLASARHALDQGRDVLAVPGPIDSPSSEGTNRLIAQGAAPLCRTGDLRAVKGFAGLLPDPSVKSLKTKEIALSSLRPDEASLLVAIAAGAQTPDQIARATTLDGTRVLALLTALELDGLVRREDHGRFRALVRSN